MQDLNLRYLYEAAKLGSMRAAADSLGVAVSSVSRQISQVEEEVGLALIEHGRRNIKLTQAGDLLIAHYSDQLRLNEAFEARLSDIKGLRTGRIQLGIGEGFIGEPLSNMLARFNAKHPGLFINVHVSASSNEVVSLVAADDAHLGLVFQSFDDPRIRVLASVRQPLCAVMKIDHPLAARKLLKLADLRTHRLCLPESSFRTRQLLQTAEADESVSLQPSVTSNSLILLKSLLMAGEFFTVLPVLAVSKEVDNGQLAAVPIDSAALQEASVQLISRLGRRLPPAPLRMVSALTNYLKACGGRFDTAEPAMIESAGT
ncbi:MAG TPA: LysR family transcriptional regulator [Steroidobacteraceae bacterium]